MSRLKRTWFCSVLTIKRDYFGPGKVFSILQDKVCTDLNSTKSEDLDDDEVHRKDNKGCQDTNDEVLPVYAD